MVPAGAPFTTGIDPAQLLRLDRRPRKVPRGPDHLPRLRDVELGLGSTDTGLLLASLLLSPTGPELRKSKGRASCIQGARFLALDGGRRVAPRRGPLLARA